MLDTLMYLGIALALGLLIGTERGWQAREAAEGSRIAGIRTFGLIGLLGGLCGVLARDTGPFLPAIGFISLAAILVYAHYHSRQRERDAGITTLVAALVTFTLGLLATGDHPQVAVAGAVATAILLSLKPLLHRWLQRLEGPELYGGLKLLLISAVLLPMLPNRTYDPWQAINPYEIWWLVVLIAALSYAGYFAMKAAGPRAGLLMTGLLGGLVSSTAVTVTLSRLARRGLKFWLLTAGILLASATMFPRVALEVGVVNPGLLPPLIGPLVLMAAAMLGCTAWLWRRFRHSAETQSMERPRPLELLPAIQFGLVLAVIMLLVRLAHDEFGEQGLYVLAILSGLADVDAITLSLARMAHSGVDPDIAARGIVIAVMANTFSKGVLATLIAGWSIGRYLLPMTLLVIGIGALGLPWI